MARRARLVGRVGQPRVPICPALPVIVPLGYLRRLDSPLRVLLVVLAVLLIVVTVVLFAAEPAPLDPCAVEEAAPLRGDAVDAAAAAAAPAAAAAVPRHGGAGARRGTRSARCPLPVRVRLPDQRTVDRVGAPRADAPGGRPVGGTALTTTCYLLVAGGAYATFGSRVDADLLVSYPRAAIVARVALVYVVVLSHPVVCTPSPARSSR